MSAALRHRGPDDSGLCVLKARDQRLRGVFAHRRLSIIDRSAAGRQPMRDAATGNLIVYNGELYNFRDLRDELIRLGQGFVSQTDTEVVLNGYAAWGTDVLSRMRGMFAFAIYDAGKQAVLLARDRLGIKPLYFSSRVSEVGFVFASEMRALLASELIKRRLCAQALFTYLSLGFVVDPLTMIQDVEALMPGHYLIVGLDGTVREKNCYWRRERGDAHEGQDVADYSARLRETLEDTVRRHLISDVPLGAFLSGGIDSSALAALMTRVAPGQINTFSLVFDDRALSEERYSRAVARALKTTHQETRLSEAEFVELLDDALLALDQPTADAINSYVISRKCKQAGLTVAIAGTGGDELFGGYTSFARVPRALAALRAYHRLPRWARGSMQILTQRVLVGRNGHMPSAGLPAKVAALLDEPPDALAVYQLSRRVLLPELCDRLMTTETRNGPARCIPDVMERLIHSEMDGLDDVRAQVSLFEQRCYLANQLLRDTDAVSMSVSLEVRVPLLDHILLELLDTVPPHIRFDRRPAKRLLVESVRDILPPAAYQHRKQGFVLPIGRWLEGPLAESVERTVTDPDLVASVGLRPAVLRAVWDDYRSASRRVYFTRIWSLFVLLDWCRRHEVTLE